MTIPQRAPIYIPFTRTIVLKDNHSSPLADRKIVLSDGNINFSGSAPGIWVERESEGGGYSGFYQSINGAKPTKIGKEYKPI